MSHDYRESHGNSLSLKNCLRIMVETREQQDSSRRYLPIIMVFTGAHFESANDT